MQNQKPISGTTEVSHSLLLVESSTRMARLLTILLETHGYGVRVCETGADAIAAMGDGVFDLVLLEAALDDMHGFDLCQIIRHDARLKNVPIVFVSALARDLDVARGINAGARAYLTKPFAATELLETVARLLDNEGAETEGSQP